MLRKANSGCSKGDSKGCVNGRTGEELALLETTVAGTKKQSKRSKPGRRPLPKRGQRAEAAIRDFTTRKVEHARRLEKKEALRREQANLAQQLSDLEKRPRRPLRTGAEFKTLEGQVAALPEKEQQLEHEREQKAQADRLAAEQQFIGRERADLAARLEKDPARLARLDWDAENAAGLRAECRAALRIVGTVPAANLDNLAAAKNVEVDRSLGT